MSKGHLPPAELAKLKLELSLDLFQFALDLVGLVEPTPFADSTSALVSLARRDWLGAGCSALSILPYLGDMAKAGKLGKYVESFIKAINLASRDAEFAKALRPAFENLKSVLDRIPLNTLPDDIAVQLRWIQQRINSFLNAAPIIVHTIKPFANFPRFRGKSVKEVLSYLDNPKHGFIKVKDAVLDHLGRNRNDGGSAIYLRKHYKSDGSVGLVEAVRVDVRGHTVAPHIPKDGLKKQAIVDVKVAFGEPRHMHKELIDGSQIEAYLAGGLRDAKGKYMAPPQYDDAGNLTRSFAEAHIWLEP